MKRLSILSSIAAGCLCCLLNAADGPTAKVIGGRNATTDYPWMAALVRSASLPDVFNGQFCGGTLIHPRYVITAAHCVESIEPEDVVVYLDVYDLRSPGTRKYDVVEIIVHNGYNTFTLDRDIALLVLAEAVEGIEPVPMVTAEGDEDEVDNTVRAIGWGRLGPDPDDGFPSILQEVDLTVISNATVNSPAAYDGGITENMISAGNFLEGGVDTCPGDSGGPLLHFDAGMQPTLIGLTSWGYDCGAPLFPGLYTRVSRFRQWVNGHIAPEYTDWELQFGIEGEAFDPDLDGFANVIEFQWQTDPTNPQSSPDLLSIISTDDSETITLSQPELLGGAAQETSIETASSSFAWRPIAQPSESFSVSQPRFFRMATDYTKELTDSLEVLPFETNLRRTIDPIENPGVDYREFVLGEVPFGNGLEIAAVSDSASIRVDLYHGDNEAPSWSSGFAGIGTMSVLAFSPDPDQNYRVRVTTANQSAPTRFNIACARLIVGPGRAKTGSLNSLDEFDPNYLPSRYYKDDFFLLTSRTDRDSRITLVRTSGSFGPFISLVHQLDEVQLDSANGETSSTVSLTVPNSNGLNAFVRVTTGGELETGDYRITTAIAPPETTK